MSTAQHGFDLTSFETVQNWQYVADQLGLKPSVGGENGAFVWENQRGLIVVTGNNPATGQYRSAGRDPEPGYASYIGIEGPDDEVQEAAFLIRNTAIFIKGESPGTRSFI